MLSFNKKRGIRFKERIDLQLKLYKDWYSKNEFEEIARRERNRSNRTNLPISYVLIELSRRKKEKEILSEKEYYTFLEKIIFLVQKNTRNFDIKCLVNDYSIGILLVDTSEKGAKTFIEKISKTLFNYFKSFNKEEYIQMIQSIVLSSYPVQKILNGLEKKDDSPIIINQCLIITRQNKKKPSIIDDFKLRSKDSSDIQFDWDIRPSASGTLSLTRPVMEDIFHINQKKVGFYIAKRIVDIIGSIVGIILFAPVILVASIAIKLTSKGPILFKQTRLGKLGEPFSLMKFRTMVTDCDDSIHKEYIKKLISGDADINQGDAKTPMFKLVHDPRITRIGKILRKTSLDELPQFFNVLKGEMSLVGPRPPIPYEVESYKNWHLMRILDIKPGITGLWQAYARSQTSFEDMVRLDIQYVNNQSALLDIKIILKTFSAVFATEGAI